MIKNMKFPIEPTEFVCAQNYGPRMKKGDVVIVDTIRILNNASDTGVQVRIINLWKRPQWFDSGWLEEK